MFKKVLATGAMLALAVSAAQAAPVLVFDNISNSRNAVAGAGLSRTTSTPNSFMGDGYTLLSGTQDITGFDLFPVNGTTAPFTGLKLIVYVWGTVNTGTVSVTAPAFSNLLGTYTLTRTGTFTNGFYFPFEGSTPAGTAPGFALPAPLTVTSNTIGLTFTYQGTTDGTNYATADNLTSEISYGTPATVGSNTFDGYYRNGNGEVNGNFTSGVRSFGQTNQSVAVRVYGDVAAPEPSQYAAFGLGLLGLGGLALKARRRNVTA